MLIDARGLKNPEHIREFKRHLEGLCSVFVDVDVLIDDDKEDLRKFEIYIRACRADYTVEKEDDGHLRVKIKGPFSMCG